MERLITLTILVLVGLLPGYADNSDSKNYQPENINVKIDKTNLPIVFIDTKCGEDTIKVIHKDYRVSARMKIIANKEGINYGDTIAHAEQTIDYEGWIAIRYRGNSSFDLSNKKPFSIKTMKTNNPEGQNLKTEIMGMPKDHDWVMMAPYADRSMIRDVLMFQLARPFLDYTPKAKYCELILDGTYYGVYIMAERPRKGKNRLNLDDPGDSGDELTGGYHLQIDRQKPYAYNSKYPALDQYGNPYSSYYRIYFQHEHPEYLEMMPEHPEQLAYIHNQINLMEDALKSDDHAEQDRNYRKYIDIISFIDYELSEEFSGNIDGYRQSTHLYKRRDSVDPRFKLTIWDFNIAFGNVDFDEGWRNDIWHYQNTYVRANQALYKRPFWWATLMNDPEYVKLLKERWALYRQTTYSNQHINETIDSLTFLLNVENARIRNYEAFPIWGKYVWPVPNYDTVNTWEKEIQFLKTWIQERIDWMDKELEYDKNNLGILNHLTADIKKRIVGYYNIQGTRLLSTKKGLIIIQYQDGTSDKMFIK